MLLCYDDERESKYVNDKGRSHKFPQADLTNTNVTMIINVKFFI
jgi:hypothetical protein